LKTFEIKKTTKTNANSKEKDAASKIRYYKNVITLSQETDSRAILPDQFDVNPLAIVHYIALAMKKQQ
jgi:hypothetical protein